VKHTPALVSLFAVALAAAPARAQDCGCDHELGVDVTVFDGAEQGVSPGDVVCVMAGEREFLRLRHLDGTPDAPITVINCGGRAVIRNTERAYALVVEDDSHDFRITGTGDPEHEYGFDISAPDREPYPGVGVWLIGRSTRYEVDHLEIHDTGFAGVSAKTDPLCDGSADQDVFVQESTHLHHLWIHDTGGEGFYIGSTQSNGHTINCDGASEVHQPHFLDGLEVHDNLVEDTGWDGAQIGMARVGCRFYRNTIRRVGLERVEFQMQGLQIGTFSRCDVFSNVIEDGPANGIIILGADDTFVHSNRIVGFTMADGIYANARDVIDGARYRFAFNTIEGWDRGGITVFGGGLGPSEAVGNLLIGAGEGVGAGGDVDWTEEGNVVVATHAEGGFTGPDEWYLEEDSVARGAAVAVEGIDVDLDGYPRADPPSAGAYEYREPGVDAGPPIGPPPPSDAGARPDSGMTVGPGADAGSGDGGTDDGGCGCRTVNGSSAPAAPWLLGLGALVFWRRRRRG